MSTAEPEPDVNLTPADETVASGMAEEFSPVDRVAEFHQRLVEATPRTFMTQALIGINVLVFVAMVATGVHLMEPTVGDLLKWGANFGGKTIGGEWWRILTCCFIHIGLIHLLLNMWVLADVGILMERMFGNWRFLGLYLFSGLTGSLASLFWNPLLTSAGASGAIFGVYGALLGVLVRRSSTIPVEALSSLRSSGLSFVGFNLFYGMMHPNIDSAAHLGGLAGGFLCGLVLHIATDRVSSPLRLVKGLAVGIAGLILIVGAMFGVKTQHGQYVEVQKELEHFIQVESDAVEKYNAAVTKAQQMQITDLEIADIMKNDILPEWRDSIARFSAFDAQVRAKSKVEPLLNYMRLRESQWSIFEEACREQDPQKAEESKTRGAAADAALQQMVNQAGK